MDIFALVITNVSLLIVSFACHNDDRRPVSTKLRYKYRVKDNSILRKIIKLKDKAYYPCNYFKVIPIYVFLALSIVSVILFAIDKLSYGTITGLISEKLIVNIAVYTYAISIAYYIVVSTWWEIVDYKEKKIYKENRAKKHQKREKR